MHFDGLLIHYKSINQLCAFVYMDGLHSSINLILTEMVKCPRDLLALRLRLKFRLRKLYCTPGASSILFSTFLKGFKEHVTRLFRTAEVEVNAAMGAIVSIIHTSTIDSPKLYCCDITRGKCCFCSSINVMSEVFVVGTLIMNDR